MLEYDNLMGTYAGGGSLFYNKHFHISVFPNVHLDTPFSQNHFGTCSKANVWKRHVIFKTEKKLDFLTPWGPSKEVEKCTIVKTR